MSDNTQALKDERAEMSKDDKKVPHQLKFWRVSIPFGCLFLRSQEIMYVVDIDFRARTVRVHNSLGDKSSNNSDPHYWPSEKEAFTDAMRFFTVKDGFDGITIADMSMFLEKVALRLVKPFLSNREGLRRASTIGDSFSCETWPFSDTYDELSE